ncbi:MAG: hypothetical protein Q4F31_05330 [Eubacteriales bacterium]|nr:hypothetical protein [Eubacteriales bacterium]
MKGNTGVTVDRNSGSGRNAIIFFALAVVFRCLGIIQHAGDLLTNKYSLFSELVLPLTFCALMILCIVLFGKNHFWLSIIPLMIGILFFILRSFSLDNILARKAGEWSVAIHICVYLLVLMLYSCSVLRFPVLKWALIPIFILGSVYHVIFEDYPAIMNGGESLSFSSVMNELSILFIVLGLIFAAFAFQAVAAEKADKPAEKKEKAKKKGLFARLFSKKKKKPEQNTAGAETSEVKQEPVSVPETPAAPQPESLKQEESLEDKPVFDESFFDTPYTATLTLDPQPDPNEGSASAAQEE